MKKPEKNSALCPRRMSVGSSEAQAQEIQRMCRYFEERPALVEQIRAEVDALSIDPGIKKSCTRQSHRLQSGSECRTCQEAEDNRKLRSIHRFQADHKEIESITDKWRDVLLCGFNDLVKYMGCEPISAYNAYSLGSIHIAKEELDIYEPSESEPSLESCD
ncbi:uncharacterized protein NEMAJ01_1850 [Nematocida major]|uniref:uncharacterized protein n=1 Tax=Nematocida major TaxID=1912982 RepID=UPI0020072559|nr:uncharacterized protein NEMAJ01_1850 [Nematocida major]KAH9386954.1 hypothetical protein NEMAJ01_1850 [Nematocida major]